MEPDLGPFFIEIPVIFCKTVDYLILSSFGFCICSFLVEIEVDYVEISQIAHYDLYYYFLTI